MEIPFLTVTEKKHTNSAENWSDADWYLDYESVVHHEHALRIQNIKQHFYL
jgi:hypothetical protein